MFLKSKGIREKKATLTVICKIIVGRRPQVAPTGRIGRVRCMGKLCSPAKCTVKGERYRKATGIVRRVDDLGRIVIPKEIRRTLKIREGDLSQTTLTSIDRLYAAIHNVVERYKAM